VLLAFFISKNFLYAASQREFVENKKKQKNPVETGLVNHQIFPSE
jgi:hypothetical protein